MTGPRWWVAVAASAMLAVAGCGAAADPGPTASASVPSTAGAIPETGKAPITVPGLGVTSPDDAVTAAPSSAAAVPVTPAETVAVPDPSTGTVPVETAPGQTVPGETVPVETVPVDPGTTVTAPASATGVVLECGGCVVLGASADLVDGLTAVLTSANGRATLLAVDATGAVRAAANIPYGVSFPPPADGRLACAGGLCVIVAMTTDASAVLSAFALESGAWTDLSGDSGFLSATQKGMAVPVDGSLGVAIQISDGTTTVWTVLVRSGGSFTTLGCAPDGAAPDLAALSITSCPS